MRMFIILYLRTKVGEACNVVTKTPFDFITYYLHLRRTYLSRDKPIASSRVGSPSSAIYAPYFKFQYLLIFLRLSSSWLRLVRLPITSIILAIWSSITCFRTQFLRKMWSISLVSFLSFFFIYSMSLSSLTVRNIPSVYHIRSKWSSPAFSSTTFQNFHRVTDLFF